jgi:hypothetical protein
MPANFRSNFAAFVASAFAALAFNLAAIPVSAKRLTPMNYYGEKVEYASIEPGGQGRTV